MRRQFINSVLLYATNPSFRQNQLNNMSAMNVSALQVVISRFSLISLFLYFIVVWCSLDVGFPYLFCPASEKKEKKKGRGGGGGGSIWIFFFLVLMPAGFGFRKCFAAFKVSDAQTPHAD